MVSARSDPEQDRFLFIVEDRRADRDVGQVGASIIGGINGVDVAGPDLTAVLADDRFDRAVHRAKVNRHMRRVGDKRAIVREDGA